VPATGHLFVLANNGKFKAPAPGTLSYEQPQKLSSHHHFPVNGNDDADFVQYRLRDNVVIEKIKMIKW